MKHNRYKYRSQEDYIEDLEDLLPELQAKRNRMTVYYNVAVQENRLDEIDLWRKKIDIVNLHLLTKTNAIANYYINQRKRFK